MDLPNDDSVGEYDQDEDPVYDFCPKCGREYDDIDYEYQICHYCNHARSNFIMQ